MDVRFVACDEVRPERDPLTTERERTRESGTVADPTRREHGDRRNGGHGHRHELPDRRRAAHMSPSLDSLRDHGVDAHRYRCLGLLNGSNLNQHLEPPRVRLFDERRRIAPKQHDRGRSFLSRGPKLGLEKPRSFSRFAALSSATMTLIPKGRRVSVRIRSISARIASGGMPLAPRTPNPPACETAATSSRASTRADPGREDPRLEMGATRQCG
jgi:hypothetical protein